MGCCGVLVACLDPDKKSRCWTEATNRLSLCCVCVEESVCCHVPSLKKFGVCFSWEVPVRDLTKQFSAVQPLSTEAWGPSAAAGGGLYKCSLARSSRNTKCSLLCYPFVRGSCCSRVFFLCADFLLGQTDFVAFGGWKSSARMPLAKQTEPKRVVVDVSEGVDVRV